VSAYRSEGRCGKHQHVLLFEFIALHQPNGNPTRRASARSIDQQTIYSGVGVVKAGGWDVIQAAI
jgi:hypothetical protein